MAVEWPASPHPYSLHSCTTRYPHPEPSKWEAAVLFGDSATARGFLRRGAEDGEGESTAGVSHGWSRLPSPSSQLRRRHLRSRLHSLPSSRLLPALLSLPFPAGLYLPCSSCRSARHLPDQLSRPFRPVPTWPGLPAVPPASALPVSRRSAGTWLSCFLCRFQLVPTFSTHPAIPEESTPPAFNKLYLNSVKFCLSLRWGPNLN